MSMTKEEAIEALQKFVNGYEKNICGEAVRQNGFVQAIKVVISALRPITREQVEQVWRGEWEPGNPICPICGKDKFDGLEADIWADWMPNFCPHCGAPMTDKAVGMVMERLEALGYDKDD